ESLEVAALLYGTLPKFDPSEPPAFLSLKLIVISMKPTGVMLISPSFNCNGDDTGAAAACGEAEARAAAGDESTGQGLSAGTWAGGGASMGAVDAIKRCGDVGRCATVVAPAAPTCSSSFFCSASVDSSCSISFCCWSSCAFSLAMSACVTAVFSAGSAPY